MPTCRNCVATLIADKSVPAHTHTYTDVPKSHRHACKPPAVATTTATPTKSILHEIYSHTCTPLRTVRQSNGRPNGYCCCQWQRNGCIFINFSFLFFLGFWMLMNARNWRRAMLTWKHVIIICWCIYVCVCVCNCSSVRLTVSSLRLTFMLQMPPSPKFAPTDERTSRLY